MLRLARKFAAGWVPPIPGVSLDVYGEVASALEGFVVKIKFNGTYAQIATNIEAFVELGCDVGALPMIAPADLPSAIKKLTKEVIPSYR